MFFFFDVYEKNMVNFITDIRKDLGIKNMPFVIANTGIDDIDRSLAKLYAEDADWNALVEALSTAKIDRQVRPSEMFKGFVGDLSDIRLRQYPPSLALKTLVICVVDTGGLQVFDTLFVYGVLAIEQVQCMNRQFGF